MKLFVIDAIRKTVPASGTSPGPGPRAGPALARIRPGVHEAAARHDAVGDSGLAATALVALGQGVHRLQVRRLQVRRPEVRPESAALCVASRPAPSRSAPDLMTASAR